MIIGSSLKKCNKSIKINLGKINWLQETFQSLVKGSLGKMASHN